VTCSGSPSHLGASRDGSTAARIPMDARCSIPSEDVTGACVWGR